MGTLSSTSKLTRWLSKVFGPTIRSKAEEIKSFRDNLEADEAFNTRDLGTRAVRLEKIVGSVGRYHDFDSTFRLKDHLPHERLESVKKMMREGKPLPPVELYQFKDEYYVLDGHHRVSAAKEFGYEDIEARIVQVIPGDDTLENMLYRERGDFNERAKLPELIELTEVGRYVQLERQILKHRSFLDHERGSPVSFQDAVLDWYKTIYLPLVAAIRKGNLIESFPNRTLADLYVYISWHQWEKGSTRKYGIGIDQSIPKDMEAFRKKMSDKKELEYPEMKREITAFVLMNVAAKREYKIIDKLYELDEVREIHSVHGEFDIIAKIVLTRDLITSDAETIGQFVHNQVRQVPGVVSTQTLIPGFSKIKKEST
jgi:DNA-binding Lrp family transcriptional regulator